MEMKNMKLNGDAPPRKRKCETWRKRSRLEKYLIVVCIATFIAFISMLAVVIYLDHLRSKQPICNTSVCRRKAGRMMSFMDLNVDPCEDFYNFSCGSFRKVINVPSGVNRYGSFAMIEEFMMAQCVEALESVEEDEPDYIKKLKAYYNACMKLDPQTSLLIEQMLNASGLHQWPILENDDYDEVHLVEKAMAIIIIHFGPSVFYTLRREINGTSFMVTIYPGTAYGNPNKFPNETDATSVQRLNEYKELLTYSLLKAGVQVEAIETAVNELVEFETLYTKVRNNYTGDENHTEFTMREFSEKCKEVSVAEVMKYIFAYFDHADDYNDEEIVSVASEQYAFEMCELLTRTDKRIIYNYVVWRFLVEGLKAYDPHYKIGEPMDEDHRPPTKSRLCIQQLEYGVFSLALGYLLVNRLEPKKTIEEVSEFGAQIKEVMDDMFSIEGWLDKEGRKFARERLSNISAEIGYSEVSSDILEKYFSDINVYGSHIENLLNEARRRVQQHMFNDTSESLPDIKIFSPWEVSAYFVGDYYVLTLGLLQRPFYEYGSPKYINLAVVGTIIGHELSHGYESLDYEHGRNSTDSPYRWSDEVIESFKERKQCYVDQYFKYPLDNNGTMVNGNETIGDNIADNSGLIQAFRAYEKYYLSKSQEPGLPGLDYTNEQLFFISYAQTWCETVRNPVKRFEGDSHSPGRYRVIGPLQNFPRFSKVFNCPLGSPMNPEKKCRMWG